MLWILYILAGWGFYERMRAWFFTKPERIRSQPENAEVTLQQLVCTCTVALDMFGGTNQEIVVAEHITKELKARGVMVLPAGEKADVAIIVHVAVYSEEQVFKRMGREKLGEFDNDSVQISFYSEFIWTDGRKTRSCVCLVAVLLASFDLAVSCLAKAMANGLVVSANSLD